MLEITGLPQIGKSAIISKALSQSGKSATKMLELSETSSADFIVFEILKLGGVTHSLPYPDFCAACEEPTGNQSVTKTRRLVYRELYPKVGDAMN